MTTYSAFSLIERFATYGAASAVLLFVVFGLRWGKRHRGTWISASLIFFFVVLGDLCHLLSRPLDHQRPTDVWLQFAVVVLAIAGYSLMYLFAALKASSGASIRPESTLQSTRTI
jgi:hypothetical protein